MRRFSLLLVLAAACAAAPALPGPASAAPDPEDTGAFGTAGRHVAGATGRIRGVVAPTSAAPAFAAWGDELRVELAAPGDAVPNVVLLRPSFGGGPTMELPVAAGGLEASRLWQGPWERVVRPLTATIPPGMTPGLYDVLLPGGDGQRRALAVYDAWPETVRLVLVADPQTGDPRALLDAFQDGTGVDPRAPHATDPDDVRAPPDAGPTLDVVEELVGVDPRDGHAEPRDRWGPYRAAIREINALRPDLVLFSGDLTFGQLVPASYHVEYEEAWTLLNGGTTADGAVYEGFHVPTLLSPGNHDAYVADGEDGLAFWMAYFGPPAFAVRFGDVTLVSIDTYDWSELDRAGVGLGVSAWGGQVRDRQLAWVRATLCRANDGEPVGDAAAPAGVGCVGAADRRVVTFAHHSPSWEQDRFDDEYGGFYGACPCEGTPGLEQVARGAVTFTTTGQGWTGLGRLELRDTLREFRVDLHAAGHSHRDRVARDVGTGDVVEVPQRARAGLDIRQLHIVTRDDAAFAVDQAAARALLVGGSGPLYVETTTTASETDEYYGYRPVRWHADPAGFPPAGLGIPPFEMGFPMTQELLDRLARAPERWNQSHAAFGLFSTPTTLP